MDFNWGGIYLMVEYKVPLIVFSTGKIFKLFATSLRGKNFSLAVDGTKTSTMCPSLLR